jgi:predicted PurR-regulated permease PerM
MKTNFNLTLQEIFFFLILVLLSAAFFNIISPFIADLFITIILVILFKRPYRFFQRKFKKRPSAAALMTVMFAAFSIILPLFLVGLMVSHEATTDYSLLMKKWPEIEKNLTQENVQNYLKQYPFLERQINTMNIDDFKEKIGEFVGKVSSFTLQLVQDTFMNLTMLFLHSFVVLFMMYYMLTDGKQLLERIHFLVPLNDDDEREMISNLEKVTDAVVFNSFLFGVIEGLYGGILFAILGVPSPVFFGIMMTVLSIIPLVGANTILLPAALIELAVGNTTTGILILVLGVAAVLINQNIIRPRFDGKKSGMHPAISFLAGMGGLVWLGIIGFIAGPMLAALFITVWNQFGKKYEETLNHFNKE